MTVILKQKLGLQSTFSHTLECMGWVDKFDSVVRFVRACVYTVYLDLDQLTCFCYCYCQRQLSNNLFSVIPLNAWTGLNGLREL